jgi:outer membrane biosynthesis protein TonB
MSASEPPQDPNAWNPDDTSAVPVGPEPEPTGAGGSGGSGGWGQARVEPFAIAALVWAVVSIVIPVIGTIVAFVLAARAADLIRRSRGERTGTQYVTAARIVAGAVLALWIIGGIAFLALRGGDSSNDNVAVPTQPPATTIAPPASSTSTTAPVTTTTTHPPVTTTAPPPTITVIPPPPTTVPPTTTPPTSPPTTTPPTQPPTTLAPTTTKPVTPTTTTPEQAAAKVQAKALQKIGDSNRGVPNDARVVVTYTPGKDLLVTWAINNGDAGEHPTGTPTCSAPPTDPPTSTEPTTTTTTIPDGAVTTTTTLPAGKRTTQQQSRFEAKQLLQSIKPQITSLHLDITGVQLVGTYPIEATGDDDVVQVLYTKATVLGNLPAYQKMFEVPPAEVVQCLNPAFDL